jgi:hypothetical protein
MFDIIVRMFIFRKYLCLWQLVKYCVYFVKNSWARTKIGVPPGAKVLVPFRPRKKFWLDTVRVPNTRTALFLNECFVMFPFTRSLQRLWQYSQQDEIPHCIFKQRKSELLSKAHYQLINTMIIRPWDDSRRVTIRIAPVSLAVTPVTDEWKCLEVVRA